MKTLFSNAILAIGSILVAVVSIEVLWAAYSAIFLPTSANNDSGRYLYLYGGSNGAFKNYSDFYVFTPHSALRLSGAYMSNKAQQVEYDYLTSTNNFGFLQSMDVKPNVDTLLILGDSFTAGEGADPWFEKVAPHINALGYQPINGGINGAGFGNFANLDSFLSLDKKVGTKKVLVIFISDDINRPIRLIPDAVVRCLSNIEDCDGSDVTYPIPNTGDLGPRLEKIRQLTLKQGPTAQQNYLKYHLKHLLPASNIVFSYFKKCFTEGCIISPINLCSTQGCLDSKSAIERLMAKYGKDNVLFLHLPEREELSSGPDQAGTMARGIIEKVHGRLMDGFKNCDLKLNDYYRIDGHPNAQGYKKISLCVTAAIDQLTRTAP